MRAQASAQYIEGQLDRARRQIFQDEVILPHVMESEYLAFAEAYHQYMNAESNSQGLSHARGVAEHLSRRLQRTEAAASAWVTGLEQYDDRWYAEECVANADCARLSSTGPVAPITSKLTRLPPVRKWRIWAGFGHS